MSRTLKMIYLYICLVKRDKIRIGYRNYHERRKRDYTWIYSIDLDM